jgi:hypothetical protein
MRISKNYLQVLFLTSYSFLIYGTTGLDQRFYFALFFGLIVAFIIFANQYVLPKDIGFILFLFFLYLISDYISPALMHDVKAITENLTKLAFHLVYIILIFLSVYHAQVKTVYRAISSGIIIFSLLEIYILFYKTGELVLSSYISVALLVIFVNRKRMLFLVYILLFSYLTYNVNRTGMVLVTMSYLATIIPFLRKDKIKLLYGISLFLFTTIIAVIEYKNGWDFTFGNGRGDIWGFWIFNMINDPISLLFGYGPRSGATLQNLAAYGNTVTETGLVETFHSVFVNMLATGGVLKFLLFFWIFGYFLLIRKVKNDQPINAMLFYYSISMMATNSYGSYPGPQIESLVFTISLILPNIPVYTKSNKLLTGQKFDEFQVVDT